MHHPSLGGLKEAALLVCSMALGWFWAPRAFAACPSPYNTATCTGGTAPTNCTASGSTITCDVRASDTTAASAKFVSPGGVGDLRAWGVDGDGENFCCELSVSCIGATGCSIVIQGTSHADDFANYTASPSNDLNFTFITVEGRGGNDGINGSRLTSVVESLLGDEHDDTIHGNGGNDYIDGDDGADTLYGDDGDDEIYGHGQNDVIHAGDGNDIVDGGDGDDDLYGGDGTDEMHGGNNSDLVCGEFDPDELYGDNGDDFVYGGPGNDTYNQGNAGYDYCELDPDNTGCDDTSLSACTRTP